MSDRSKAREAATDYANIMWSQLPWCSRFWFQIKSGIFHPEEWWGFYNDCHKKVMERWRGVGAIISNYDSHIWQGMKAHDLVKMELSNRNCYLNPDQIAVLEELSSLKGRVK